MDKAAEETCSNNGSSGFHVMSSTVSCWTLTPADRTSLSRAELLDVSSSGDGTPSQRNGTGSDGVATGIAAQQLREQDIARADEGADDRAARQQNQEWGLAYNELVRRRLAESPVGIVEGDKYDSSVAAEIITGKYGYHQPLYRLQDYFAGSGWTPTRSTQNNILAQCQFILVPLLAFYKQCVQQDCVVGCDDTSVTFLYPKTLPALDLNDPKECRMHEVFSKALDKGEPSITAKM